jgi:hypothetical protein
MVDNLSGPDVFRWGTIQKDDVAYTAMLELFLRTRLLLFRMIKNRFAAG